MSGVIETVLRKDRLVIVAALVVLVVLSWAYMFWLSAGMSAMPANETMRGMSMADMAAPSFASWSPVHFPLMFAMWAAMMVGMMTPSVAPMVLIYAGVARQSESRGNPFPATAWFLSGYLIAWTGFALLATALQWALEYWALLTSQMVLGSPVMAGSVLIAAGVYQWTAYKEICLSQCQAPLAFIQRHGGFSRGRRGALKLGIRHGGYCIGCCWALMALLFVAGVMSLVWIAMLAIIVMAEKVIPAARLISRAIGAAFIGLGVWILAGQV